MLKDCNDLNVINKLLANFNTCVDEINSTYKIIEKNAEIIGFINYKVLYDEAELYYIYISPHYRLNGMGTSLIKEMIKDLIKRNISKVFLEVRISNVKAIDFYIKHGFQKINLRKDYYKSLENNSFEDAIIMERKIGD